MKSKPTGSFILILCAMLLNSAIETGCSVLWSEDFNDGQRYGTVTVKNPFL